ncbi:hypothetical protein P4B35_18645 [Pontiellaceae bacterium B12227]|nr:hypothetical protein [Pontiellaceae bacterium B12227]
MMQNIQRNIPVFLFVIGVFFACSVSAQEAEKRLIPTHADAAVIFAKHSGLFDRYVLPEANLNECVSFMNKNGIFFGLLEVVNGVEFTLDDCARVMGQIELVFTGEARFFAGKVLLPKDVDSWKDFCILEGIDYAEGYKAVIQALRYAQELNH